MEDLIKELPKEAQQAIEEVPVLKEIIEPEPEGIGVGGCIGIGIGVVILAAAFAKLYKCTSKKK
tara:strand:+ start:423 stop:614 length:192 start_codon:yes stop_codon:yes gene_type:complete